MFKTYQKKPVKVEVLKYTNTKEVNEFLLSASKNSITPATLEVEVRNCSPTHPEGFDYPVLKFKTLEGDMTVSEGDYVICGTNGEFYPIKPNIFEQCYEASSDVESEINHLACANVVWQQQNTELERQLEFYKTPLHAQVSITKEQLKEIGLAQFKAYAATQGSLALTALGKKHLDSVLYLLDGALHDHSNRNYGDRDAWFNKIHYKWEEFINEHEESLNPLEYAQQVIKGIT